VCNRTWREGVTRRKSEGSKGSWVGGGDWSRRIKEVGRGGRKRGDYYEKENLEEGKEERFRKKRREASVEKGKDLLVNEEKRAEGRESRGPTCFFKGGKGFQSPCSKERGALGGEERWGEREL